MRFWFWITTILLVDQWSKWIVGLKLIPGQSVEVWPGVMWFTHVFNRGAAFSILQGATVLFILTAVTVVLVLIGYNHLAKPQPLLQHFTGIMAGGALGNLLDRCRLGYVADFIDFHWFPVFNVADMAIVIGGIMMVAYFIWFDKDGMNDER